MSPTSTKASPSNSSSVQRMDGQALQMQRSAAPPPFQFRSHSGASAGTKSTDSCPPGAYVNNGYQDSVAGVNVNPTLKSNVMDFCCYILNNGLAEGNILWNSGARDPREAHRWSTAFGIRQGDISISTLRNLTNSRGERGRDEDGNLWYDPSWAGGDTGVPYWPFDNRNEEDLVRQNAEGIWSGALAHEGYPAGSLERRPNHNGVPMSNHCIGEAIDLTIDWTGGFLGRGGDPWSDEANAAVARFNLKRPFGPDTDYPEHWHFEPA